MSYSVANYFNQISFKPVSEYGKRIKELGKGAYGRVYKYQKEDGTSYAVKTIVQKGFLGLYQPAIREISIMTLLQHPNIAKLIDVNMNKFINIIMELAWEDLKGYLSENVLTPINIKRIFYQLVKGLEYMHSLGIWHRDIKPQNILVFPNNIVKYTDFGLGRFGALPNNMYTVPIGTLWWRSPDVLLGSSSYGPEADVWALGLILAEMAYGQYMITGTNEVETLRQIVTKIGGLTEEQWPGISGMSKFNTIRKFNEDHPTGYIFSNKILKKKLGLTGISLLKSMLTANPSKRITIKEVAEHPYFDNVRDEFNYPPIPDMVCGEQRILKDIPAPNTEYKGDIKPQMIQILIEWLNEVVDEYRLEPATFFRARSIIDQYLKATNSQIKTPYLQLLGVSALMIAGKIEEVYPPSLYDYIYISNNTYTREDVKEMEKKILKVLRFQLAYPVISEFIKYYNKGLLESVAKDAEILGKAVMISPDIPKQYQAHQIAKALVYIVSPKNINAPCLVGVDVGLVGKIIDEIERLRKVFPKLLINEKENEKLGKILKKYKLGLQKIQKIQKMSKITEPPSIYNESPKISGERLSKQVGIVFEGAREEDIDRLDVINFLGGYIMIQALKYINTSTMTKNIENKFAAYFSFVPAPNNKNYISSKRELKRITYELGALTVETKATINFNYVLPELITTFKHFINDHLADGTIYNDSKLSGYLYDPSQLYY